MHCTCDGSCGRGHAPKLCGKRRYEKRANCNQCKVSYYALTKRKTPDITTLVENMRPMGHLPMHRPEAPFHMMPQPPPNHPNWVNNSFAAPVHDGGVRSTENVGSQAPPMCVPRPHVRQQETTTFPPKPKREELEKWRRFLMEEPMKIVVWDDVKEAINKQAGESSPISNVSSEADLMSLAPVEASAANATHQPLKADGETKMFDCGTLKDPDDGRTGDSRDDDQGSFSSIDDEDEGLFTSLLDDMDVENSEWSNFAGIEGAVKAVEENLFNEVF